MKKLPLKIKDKQGKVIQVMEFDDPREAFTECLNEKSGLRAEVPTNAITVVLTIFGAFFVGFWACFAYLHMQTYEYTKNHVQDGVEQATTFKHRVTTGELISVTTESIDVE